jgi:hypothetical protein
MKLVIPVWASRENDLFACWQRVGLADGVTVRDVRYTAKDPVRSANKQVVIRVVARLGADETRADQVRSRRRSRIRIFGTSDVPKGS